MKVKLILLLFPALLPAQTLQQVLDRLDRIEQQNQSLAQQVQSLRAELAATRAPSPTSPQSPTSPSIAQSPINQQSPTSPSTAQSPLNQPSPINQQNQGAATAGSGVPPSPQIPAQTPPLTEQLQIVQTRLEEQAQSKVESSQKLPIALTGMLLFNTFLNGRASGGSEYPTIASLSTSSNVAGATLAQSVIGLKFQGPQIFGGGQISGSAYADDFGGTSSPLNHLFRLRVATVQIDWKNTTIVAGQDKPIMSPREPDSLAQVQTTPLTGAGNLWLWSTQVRVEQRFALGRDSGLNAQLGVYETGEPAYQSIAANPRPALEGRFNLWHKFGEHSRIEIAPGFHQSTTHIIGLSAPSKLASVDWLIQPFSKLQLTGMFFSGENVGGLGGLRHGVTILNNQQAVSIGANGGWSQLSYFATSRLTFNLFGGLENDRASDLVSGDVHINSMYAANAIYRLGSNVLLGAEVSQLRTNYFLLPSRLNNHYDLSLAYLF